MIESVKRVLRPLRELALLCLHQNGMLRTVNGVPYRVDPRTRWTFAAGYDVEGTQAMREAIRPGMTVWNIGAHVGVHVLQAANLVGASGRVAAFEPNPYAIKLLKRNIAFNGFDDRVQVVESAVGEAESTVLFSVSGADPMARGGRPNPLLTDTEKVRVPVTTIDAYWRQQRKSPDLIIMDIEGWEVAAILGGQEMLRSISVTLLVEFHGKATEWSGHSMKQMEAILSDLSFKVTPVSGQKDVWTDHGMVLLKKL